MLELGLKIFISYLVGSLNGALVLGRLFGAADIRTVGSGNAGATNALRTHGKAYAAAVMLLDVLKGVLPVLLLPDANLFGLPADPAVGRDWLTFACAGAAVFGHCYPVWYGFAGGKGFATTLGALGAIAPVLLVPALVAWLAMLLLFGYVGLATVVAGFAIPAYLLLADAGANLNAGVFTLALAVFIAYTHRSNLGKLIAGAAQPDVSFRLLGRGD